MKNLTQDHHSVGAPAGRSHEREPQKRATKRLTHKSPQFKKPSAFTLKGTSAGMTWLVVLAALFTAGCSFTDKDDAPPLEGERISVLELEESLEPDDAVLEAQGLLAPAPWKNSFWPQSGGYPNHSMQNLDLNESKLGRLWTANIGEGSSSDLPLTAQPILVDGLLFTLDTDGELAAFVAEDGKELWRVDVRNPDEEDDDQVISGGIAYASMIIYVTNGYDELLAVHPGDGKILWRKKLPAPSRAAPTIMDGRVFVTTLDNRLLALAAGDGTLLWEYSGLSEAAGLVGAASPAASRDIVIPVFSSGEVTALRVENGSVAWSDNLSSIRRFGGLSGISDIKALPVMDKGLVIAMSFSGKLVAIDERTGVRVWQRDIGGANTPWVAGNHVFVISSDNELAALGRDTGAIRWVTKLPSTYDDGPVFHIGPLMAGGRLIVVNSQGIVSEFNPENGENIRNWDTDRETALPPIVAGGVMYILSEDGVLTAYK